MLPLKLQEYNWRNSKEERLQNGVLHAVTHPRNDTTYKQSLMFVKSTSLCKMKNENGWNLGHYLPETLGKFIQVIGSYH